MNEYNPKSKHKVYQYNLDGKFIKLHSGVRDARRELGIRVKDDAITDVCNGKRHTAHGYIWSWDYKELFSTNPKLKRAVLQYSLNDEFINEFESIQKIHKVFNVRTSAVKRACEGTCITALGYKWKYKDQVTILTHDK